MADATDPFVLPAQVRYRGETLVLVQSVPDGAGPGAVACFDLDGDNVFEREVRSDDDGVYTLAVAAAQLPPGGGFLIRMRSADGAQYGEARRVYAIQEDPQNAASEVPVNCVPSEGPAPEPEICTCTECPAGERSLGASRDWYTHSYTPTDHGVELATGKLRWSFPITRFETRMVGFTFSLYYATLVKYHGPWGQGFSHTFNMMIVRTGDRTGRIITPDLRIYDITSEDALTWTLPRGFFSTLRLDPERCRWILTHYSGAEMQFFEGAVDKPGYPVAIRDPNGNTMRLAYDTSGLLQHVTTDLNQVQTLAFDSNGQFARFADHLRRTWRFTYDDLNRLTRLATPVTEYADLASGQEITDRDLSQVLVRAPRYLALAYKDDRFPTHITALTDQRGATPDARAYDAAGRVKTAFINGSPMTYSYAGECSLDRLEATNCLTRVVDREGNVIDYEIHGSQGGPVRGLGRFGLRRRITWTERGKGNAPLREGEPAYWEQRWLHDCHCLAPRVAVQSFSSEDARALTFDGTGIPTNWPRTVRQYNRFRQTTAEVYTDGVDSIKREFTYQDRAFGEDRQFSRLLTATHPRAFDDNPIYAGLAFVHTYAYDERGNRVRHTAPQVARGVDAPQSIVETWTYNRFGQVRQHTDPNGNITDYVYYEGEATGGDINTRGQFGGYLAAMTLGAPGSRDSAPALVSRFEVNALGMITRRIDPKGLAYASDYNNLQELTRRADPAVTLPSGHQVCYETRYVYDGAGHTILERRTNVDADGSIPGNQWIDRAMSYDDVGNLLSRRIEIDAVASHDLITRFAYDRNDHLAVTQKPEGNREFVIYDERQLAFRTFSGVAPGATPDEGLPRDKRIRDLASTAFISLTIDDYDARGNHVRRRDGRGNITTAFFDFHNRQVAWVDPNGNGWIREYDDDSNLLTIERGGMTPATGRVADVLERTYYRYDEAGRRFQTVRDFLLQSDERRQVDPADDENSSYRDVFDPGSRVVSTVDANGNTTTRSYDAADRLLATTDAVGNVSALTYDPNSNVIQRTTTEVAGPEAGGRPEIYVTTQTYDELNRRIETRIRGLNGTSVDDRTRFAYDSRSNMRLIADAEGNVALKTFDDADREVRAQRFDRDPARGDAVELLRYERAYDRNSRLTEERAYARVDDPGSVQVTRRAYDDLDRVVRIVYPDATASVQVDDRSAGARGDLVAIAYDANGNAVTVSDQRGVVWHSSFDAGNRLTSQRLVLPAGVPGVSRHSFDHDALNRVVAARNDDAAVHLAFDPLSRQVAETQRINLDGRGFERGWQHPVVVRSSYDKQSNRIAYSVFDGDVPDLQVATSYDRLNRTTTVAAAYFDRPFHPIAAYSYVGPDRLKTKMLGNGAALTRTFDGKRRLQTHEWTGSHVLLRFAYAYDRMDNCLLERFEHEPGACDYFAYNNRYEIVDVRYERGGSPAGREVFCYDDVFNRRQAYSEDPAAVGFPRIDTYFANQANEYVQLLRNGRRYDLTHDEAGNATRLPLRDPLATGRGPDRLASAQWDASNCLFTLQADAVGQRGFRYDAFRRRIASFVLRDGKPAEGRRYLYDRWWVVEERLFDRNAAHTDAPGHLERVYVHGQLPDEHLLTAIDADQDGRLVLDSTCTADSPVDQEYYLLCNRLGSIMALLHADDADRVIERYSYSVYGEPRMPVESPPDGRRARSAPSPAGNPCFFAGQRLDGDTGLYYCRNRYYDARAGRFLSRDYYRPHGAPNLYQYVGSNPVNFTDPFGLFRWNGFFMFTEWDFVFDNDIAWIDFTIDFECDPTTGTISAVLPRVDPYAAETFGGKVVDSDIVWAPATACCINVIYGVTVVYDKSYAAAGAALGGGIGLVLGSALGPGGTVAGGATGATIGTALGTLLGWIASDEEKGGIVSRPFSICCCPNGSKSAWQTVGDARNGVYRTSDDDWYVSGYVLAADCSKQSIGAARIFWRSWQHPNEPKFPPYLFRY